jgi:hypothetical protein
VVFNLLSVARERVYRSVAPSNAGYVGMFETRLSVCMWSGVLFWVRSEVELLLGNMFTDPLHRERV